MQLRAELEVSAARADLAGTEARPAAARKTLLVLLGDAALEVGRYTGGLAEAPAIPVADGLHERVLAGYPGIAAAAAEVRRAAAALDLARIAWRPEPALSVQAGRVRDGGTDRSLLQWGLEFPLPVFDRNQGAVREAEAAFRRAEEAYRGRVNAVLGELDTLLSSYERTAAQVAEFRDQALPRGERVLDLVTTGYRQGKFSQIDVLDAQRSLASLRTRHTELLGELNRLADRLEALAGSEPADFEDR